MQMTRRSIAGLSALAHDDRAIDGRLEAIDLAAGPADFHRRIRRGPRQSEVRAEMGVGEVTCAAADFLPPRDAAAGDGHARADPVAIALAADEPDGQPVVRIAAPVLEQARIGIDAGDEQVKIAV